MSRAVAIAAALTLLLFATKAARAGEDYAAGSTAWNGLSQLFDLARSSGCEMRATDSLDWSELDGHDVLWLIYPRSPIDPRKLERFLAGGGRVVIADDFGAAKNVLAALGLRRSPERPEVPPDARFLKNPNLPVAHPRLLTELGRSTGELTANHPASFQTAIPATFEFGPGEALVVEGRVGSGTFVALADPSLFINNMLELDGNRAFARALIERTCRPGRDRILLLSSAFVARGEPTLVGGAPPDPSSPFARFNDGMRALGAAAAEAAGHAPLGLIACLFGLAALGVLQGAFPPRAVLVDRFTRVGGPVEDPQAQPGGELWDHGLPAAILREETLQRLGRALGVPVDFDRTGPRSFERRIAARFGPEAGRAAAELWRLLHRTRWRTVDGEQIPDERISRRQLVRMHERALSLFQALDRAQADRKSDEAETT